MNEIKITDPKINGEIVLHGMTIITGVDEKAIRVIKVSFENVMHSEYGMTCVYEEMRKPLDDLEHEFELKQWSLMS